MCEVALIDVHQTRLERRPNKPSVALKFFSPWLETHSCSCSCLERHRIVYERGGHAPPAALSPPWIRRWWRKGRGQVPDCELRLRRSHGATVFQWKQVGTPALLQSHPHSPCGRRVRGRRQDPTNFPVPHTGKTHREHPPVALPVDFRLFPFCRKRRRRRRRLQRSAAEVVTATWLLLDGLPCWKTSPRWEPRTDWPGFGICFFSSSPPFLLSLDYFTS